MHTRCGLLLNRMLTLGATLAFLSPSIARAAQPVFTVTSPSEYQVFQRADAQRGPIVVEGTVNENCAVEFRIGDGDWRPTTLDAATRRFTGRAVVDAGGWRPVHVRALRAGAQIASFDVEHVGVGEVFIVAGQSNSCNFGSEPQKPASGMVSSFDGQRWRVAHDPQPGAAGNGGSFIPAFGDALAQRLGVPIGVAVCGEGGTSVREWLPEGSRMTNQPTTGRNVRAVGPGEWEATGELFNRLAQRIDALGPGGFRAILWHQGESDAGQARAGYPADRQITGEQYTAFMRTLIEATRKRAGRPVPWFVAQATYHSEDDPADAEFRAAQKALWDADVALEGPDTDALRKPLRDGVHFNPAGLTAHGKLWAQKVAAWLEQLDQAPSP